MGYNGSMAGGAIAVRSCPSPASATVRDYIELTKPRITWLILMSTAIGFFFGAREGWAWLAFLHTIIGTGLIASGTAGRVSPAKACWFAVGLSVLGFVELWLGANLLTALLGAFTLLTYLFVYTPLKQKSWHATTIGAIPGAMPPMIGFAGASGHLTAEAWVLFAILFLWQFPHFYAIAWMYREDYSRAGIKMLPVIEPDGDSTIRQILGTSVLLIPISLLPIWLGMSGYWYLLGALLLGMAYVYSAIQASRERTRSRVRGVLLASVVYLPILYVLMMADRTHL